MSKHRETLLFRKNIKVIDAVDVAFDSEMVIYKSSINIPSS